MSLWSDSDRRPIDKWTHYFPIYERHFRDYVNKTMTFIRIGCGHNGTLQMWKRYFGPHAHIIGLDINPECKRFEEDQIRIRIGPQEDVGFLNSVVEEFGAPDIVLVDGSHLAKYIITSFDYFYSQITNSGVYMVEDLHADSQGESKSVRNHIGSFIEFSKTLVDDLNADYLRESLPRTVFKQNTLAIHFYTNVIVFERGRSIKMPLMVGRSDKFVGSTLPSDVGDRQWEDGGAYRHDRAAQKTERQGPRLVATTGKSSAGRRWAASSKEPPVTAAEWSGRRRWGVSSKKPPVTAAESGDRRRWEVSSKEPPMTAEEPGGRRRWGVSSKEPPMTAAEPGDRWAPTPRKPDPVSTAMQRRHRTATWTNPAITTEDQTECPRLEGWPTVSLDTLDIRNVTIEEFREVMIGGRAGATAYSVETAPGGCALARVLDCDHYSKPREIARAYLGNPRPPFSWQAEHLILLNEPCYLVVGTGVVFLGDGRIVRETVFSAEEPFEATENQTVAYRIGGGLSSVGQLPFMLRAAPALDERIWSPLLSRWSMVYGHMISESLVEDAVLHRAGFSPLISFAATGYPEGAQHIAMTQVHAPVASFMHPIVKVPRVVFASKLYRHFPLGAELRNAIRDVKARISSRADLRKPAPAKVYVSRLGVANRPMTNEADLIAHLSSMGFCIVAPQSMPFEEQVLTFRGARLIVGPYGSGLANSVFAAPGAALCELRPLHTALDSPLWDTYYYCLASTMGFSYGAHISTNPPKTDPWQCDIPQVLELIRAATATIEGA